MKRRGTSAIAGTLSEIHFVESFLSEGLSINDNQQIREISFT